MVQYTAKANLKEHSKRGRILLMSFIYVLTSLKTQEGFANYRAMKQLSIDAIILEYLLRSFTFVLYLLI